MFIFNGYNNRNIFSNKEIIVSESQIQSSLDDEGWDEVLSVYGSIIYYSKPIFTSDLRTAIIFKSLRCGAFCGYRKVQAFHLEKNNWKLIKEKEFGKF